VSILDRHQLADRAVFLLHPDRKIERSGKLVRRLFLGALTLEKARNAGGKFCPLGLSELLYRGRDAFCIQAAMPNLFSIVGFGVSRFARDAFRRRRVD